METETIILYLRIFPDVLDSSLSDVEKRLEGLGKVLFALDGGLNDYDEGDVSMQKIDMRSPQSAAVALYTFYVKVSRMVGLLDSVFCRNPSLTLPYLESLTKGLFYPSKGRESCYSETPSRWFGQHRRSIFALEEVAIGIFEGV